MAHDGPAHRLGITLRGEDLVAAVGVILRVGPALVVKVVNQAGEAPELLVLAPLAGVVTHRGFDGEAVLAEPLLFRVLAEEIPDLVAAGESFGLSHAA